MAQINAVYGNYRLQASSESEAISKLNNFANKLEIPTQVKDINDVFSLAIKALIRIRAEYVSRLKRAQKEGKQVKEKTFVNL